MFCPTVDEGVRMFPANGVRHCTPPTVVVALGSKICPCSICWPLQGLITGLPWESTNGAPINSLKSPVLSFAVGTVDVVTPPCVWRYCSHEKKKNVLSRPLYRCGMITGPPSVPP